MATVLAPQLAQAALSKSGKSDWSKKTVLITGATSGLGRKMALAFAAKGAKVAFCGRRQEKGDEVLKEIKKTPGQGFFLRADVSVEDDVKKFVKAVADQFGKIDLAVNNAGIDFDSKNFASDDMAKHVAVIQTNLLGTMFCMKYEIAEMLKHKAGSIINIASVAAVRGSANGVSYSASKHGVLGLTRSLAKNHAKDGLLINAISPFLLDHEMGGTDKLKDEGSEEVKQEKSRIPTGHLISMTEVIDTVFMIGAATLPSYTGQNLVLDGGALS